MGLEWVESLENLKLFLNCEKDEMYKEFKYFNQRILQRCQKEILEKTECCFSYEPIKKGRKVTDIRFKLESLQSVSTEIAPNQLTFDALPEVDEQNYDGDNIAFLADACGKEFSNAQMNSIFKIICTKSMPETPEGIWIARYHYLSQKYAKMNVYAEKRTIANRYNYFVKMLEKDI